MVLDLDGDVVVVGIKAVDSQDFENVLSNGAFKKNVIELMIEGWLTEQENGILIYENKNDHRYEMFQVIPYTPIIESVKQKCFMMLGLKIKGEIPKRSYKKNDSKECSICEYSLECWDK